MWLVIWWKTMKEIEERDRMFQASSLVYELEEIFWNVEYDERDWVLMARVKQHCKLD